MYNVLMKKQTLRGEQQGFASLIIAITLVIIVGLMSVGFAQLMRREINQATSRQLSNQAYYAAESGINDAAKAINNGYSDKKVDCGPITSPVTTGQAYLSNNIVDGTNSQWTCLTIDPRPDTIKYSPVDQTSPTAFVAKAVDSAGAPINFSSLTISWQDADPSSPQNIRPSTGVSNNAFPRAGAAWNAMGIVRISLTPLPDELVPIDRATLFAQTFTSYLYPASTGNNNSYGYTTAPDQQGVVMDGSCAPGRTPLRCSVNIIGLSSPRVLVTLRSIYSDTKVFISANGGAANISNAQILVDSTGRSQNVLKRIQVRIPNTNNYYYPGFTIETTGDICKQLRVRPGYSSSGC